MHEQTLPHTDLRVAEICLGTGELGGNLDRAASFALLDAYREQGGNFIDTAHVYNDWIPGEKSRSEKMIGAWLAERRCRQQVVLATKGCHFPLGTSPIQNRVTPQDLRQDLEESLHFLGTEVIDLYWLHRDDASRPVGEILEALEEARRQGKLRYYGASNWHPQRLVEAQRYAQQYGLAGFTADQMLWTAAAVDPAAIPDQTIVTMHPALFDYHRASRMPALAYTSQANGIFSKLAAGALAADSPLARQFPLAENRRRLKRIHRVMAESELTLTQVVLGWLLSQPFVTLPIVGPRRPEQLSDSLSAAGVRLNPSQVHFIEYGEE